MKKITDLNIDRPQRAIRILQFGEGNFLRAFVDYMVDMANEKGLFDGSIAVAKPISPGSIERFQNQNNLYTVLLRGKDKGKTVHTSRIITSISSVFDCKDDYNFFMSLAKEKALRFIVSNTTEAGIVPDPADSFDGLPRTYPGKLTKWLYARYKAFAGDSTKGVIILPVELIENNGKKLKECVFSLCDCWKLSEEFKEWVNDSCIFCNTLVDRIVTGYPKNEAGKICRELGYRDDLLDVGEPFGLWVIESERDIRGELPFDRAGLPVIFTNDLKPYRDRKVRVLNGAHTASVLAGYLYGLDIVRDCMSDPVMGRFIRRVVKEEIAPHVKLPEDEVQAFTESVFERFENPFIDHALLSISLNSVSKWKTRVLPSFRDYYGTNRRLPRLITFSLAALFAFYSSDDLREDGLYARRANGDEYVIHDDAAVLKFFSENNGKEPADFVRAALSRTDFWGEDLNAYPGLVDTVSHWLTLFKDDAAHALKKVLEG